MISVTQHRTLATAHAPHARDTHAQRSRTFTLRFVSTGVVSEPQRPRRRMRRRCGPRHQTEIQTTMRETIPDLLERKRTIESCGCGDCITNLATSMVHGACPCRQLCEESGAAFSSRTYMVEWLNLECIYAQVVISPVSSSGSNQTTCTWLLMKVVLRDQNPGRTQKYALEFRNPSELTGDKTSTMHPQRNPPRQGSREMRQDTESNHHVDGGRGHAGSP